MMTLPTPHGDKLRALLTNTKLPASDRGTIQDAISQYETWRSSLLGIQGDRVTVVEQMVQLLNLYRNFLDLEVIFDSSDDFLYRQKGQLKLDNSVIEEFLPLLVSVALATEMSRYELDLGPTNSFAGIRFESTVRGGYPGPGMAIRSKDQDFAISRRLYIRASHHKDFHDGVAAESALAFVAAECKTNLDKTMFQEAAATALDLKTVVPGAKYFLLCEWLDMTPISTSVTAIDEILILRKYKRLSSSIRDKFNTVDGRRKYRDFYQNYLAEHPIAQTTGSDPHFQCHSEC